VLAGRQNVGLALGLSMVVVHRGRDGGLPPPAAAGRPGGRRHDGEVTGRG
jgi:hypothetical protein